METQRIDNMKFTVTLAEKYRDERNARIALEALLERNRPKVRFADCVAGSKRTILVGELAKLLRESGSDIQTSELLDRLRDDGFLGSDSVGTWNMPTRKAVDMGLFKVKTSVRHAEDSRMHIVRTPKVTGKGQIFFMNRYAPTDVAKPLMPDEM